MTDYTPDATPGARLPHHWLPDGSSLYDRLGAGLTLIGPARDGAPVRRGRPLAGQARRRGIPLTVVQAPPSYPWGQEYLLVRPDQHIAWRAQDAAEIDLDVVTGAADMTVPPLACCSWQLTSSTRGRPGPGRLTCR